MIRTLRYLILPTAAFVIIAGLAWGEWSKVIRVKTIAVEFRKNSELRVFRDVGMREWQGRKFPTYEDDLGGQVLEFPTHARIDLPTDGRVRMGPDPTPRFGSPISELPQGEIAVPMNGPDSVETIYMGLRGHEIEEDITKASVVSVAAIIAGVAGFFLQRIIFRDVGRALRAR